MHSCSQIDCDRFCVVAGGSCLDAEPLPKDSSQRVFESKQVNERWESCIFFSRERKTEMDGE